MSFRVKLALAMLLAVVAVAGVTLVVIGRSVEGTYRQMFEERFESDVSLLAALQGARLGAVKSRCLGLARSVRLIAAMEEEDAALLHRIALDELRDVLAPAPGTPGLRRAAFFRFVGPDGRVLPPVDERAGLGGSLGRARWEEEIARAGGALGGAEEQQVGGHRHPHRRPGRRPAPWRPGPGLPGGRLRRGRQRRAAADPERHLARGAALLAHHPGAGAVAPGGRARGGGGARRAGRGDRRRPAPRVPARARHALGVPARLPGGPLLAGRAAGAGAGARRGDARLRRARPRPRAGGESRPVAEPRRADPRAGGGGRRRGARQSARRGAGAQPRRGRPPRRRLQRDDRGAGAQGALPQRARPGGGSGGGRRSDRRPAHPRRRAARGERGLLRRARLHGAHRADGTAGWWTSSWAIR